jgi:fatty acid amide hydrolase
MSELWQKTASELSSLLGRGEVSSREVVRAHFDRIEAVDGKVRAFTTLFRDRAMADAARADDERSSGRARGPLHGLPVSIKECFDMEGLATTLGLESWKSRIAKSDAAMVTLLRGMGAVILGRTNLSQTMLFVESRNPVYGQTANPFSLAHTPGGSSGGEAAAVAAGMSPLGIGTDIGGSIRTPCHFSGVFGIKPTLDRLPCKGQRTVLDGQEVVRSQNGPIARSSADLELFLRAVDPQTMTSLDGRVPPVSWESPRPLDGLRVGVFTDDGMIPPSRAVVRAVEWAREALLSHGCVPVGFTPPRVEELVYAYIGALSADGAETLLGTLEGKIDPVLMPLKRIAVLPKRARQALARAVSLVGERRTARMLEAMGEKSVAEYWRLTAVVRAYRATVIEAMEAAKVDVLLCPAYATPAVPHGMAKNFTLASSYSMLWNATQMPAGVVPITRVRTDELTRAHPRDSIERHAAKVDKKSVGLPVGVQVVGRPWAEPLVLSVMRAIEDDVAGDPEFPKTPVLSI